MVVSFQVFKKSSLNGKVHMYLTKRQIRDFVTHAEDIEGAVLIDPSFVGDRRVYAQVVLRFRFGREDDETMGLNFTKTLCVETKQVYPPVEEHHATEIQVSSVSLHIERVQSLPSDELTKPPPHGSITRNFLTCSGTVTVEVSLDAPVYRQDQDVTISVNVINKTSKDVKKLKVKVMQLSEVPMFSHTQRREKTLSKAEEALLLPPGACTQRAITLVALVPPKRAQGMVFLQGSLTQTSSGASLAQTTLLPSDVCRSDVFGILVSYIVRVKA
ncbi:phosrestin-2 [Hyalella azteca]|uniref:Phosrestin-2 n=1 Tax=Hyalella azteca TaxID=294128 RepID=A0A8B7PN23_HYAAZ|nr:phosrestin-2 [Hyalella azteca]